MADVLTKIIEDRRQGEVYSPEEAPVFEFKKKFYIAVL